MSKANMVMENKEKNIEMNDVIGYLLGATFKWEK